jgi:hypothetical protein
MLRPWRLYWTSGAATITTCVAHRQSAGRGTASHVSIVSVVTTRRALIPSRGRGAYDASKFRDDRQEIIPLVTAAVEKPLDESILCGLALY